MTNYWIISRDHDDVNIEEVHGADACIARVNAIKQIEKSENSNGMRLLKILRHGVAVEVEPYQVETRWRFTGSAGAGS